MATEIVKTDDPNDRAMDRLVTGNLVEWATGREAKEDTRRFYEREVRDFARLLAGPEPSPMVLTLAQTAALCWFALRTFEHKLARASSSPSGVTFAESDYQQRRIDRAHRRYLATLKTLATVRRLAVPALQINVAGQQVNVAGLSAGATASSLRVEGKGGGKSEEE